MRFSKRMHTWKQFHGWMELYNLDQGHGLTQAYTIGYRFIDRHDDMWTKRFNDFKKKHRPALRGGAGLMRSTVPELVRKLGINTTKIAFVPGLSSNENIASSSGVLSRLTHFCAEKTNVKFIRNAITKKTPRATAHG
ncbi:MAG: hypothetical protein OXD33_04155 [Rhodobacteraceae bacterium]|nr:hypothetical protein [Paracoccaceae bacterium]